MRFRTTSCFILIVLTAIFIAACSNGGDVETEAPQQELAGLSAIVPDGAQLKQINVDFAFDTAGLPFWFDGELYFTNNNFEPRENSKTMKINASGELEIIRDYNGVTTASYPTGSGTFYCCEMVGHRISEMAADGTVIRTLAGEYNGIRLDGPNDMTLDRKGGVYFTDSHFSPGEDLMQDAPAVYYVKPDGAVIRVAEGITFPNGLELSPDENTLYVVNTKDEVDKGRTIYAYDVNADGTLSGKRDFAVLKLSEANEAKADGVSGADGTAMDSAGNLYVATTQGMGIQIFDKNGEHLGSIPYASASNNLSFGDADMKTLYVSAKEGVFKIKLNIAGKIQGKM